MKQAHLAGRTKGLRPSQHRQLDRLSQRRHPGSNGADTLTLERLAELVLDLDQPLHLIIDERGLCRLLWVGELNESGQLMIHLPGGPRRTKRRWRLISSLHGRSDIDLKPEGRDAVVALDLKPDTWLRYHAMTSSGGGHQASLWQPDPSHHSGWNQAARGNLTDLCDRPQHEPSPQIESSRPAMESSEDRERVLLLILKGADLQRSERDIAELEGLVRSAGGLPVAICGQRQGLPNPQTLWGTGKLQEAALEARRHQATLVITDRELSPVQARNLEQILDCPVMDRSELILDIFAQRAASSAGRLQVELAQLRYRLPRLKGRGLSLSRQGGGIGTRGPGETQLEKDRRAISRRLEHLERSLHQLGAHRSRLRNRREGLPRVALVGYTNAGKSSLLNALCSRNPGHEVLAENKLFATLDPTTRRLSLPQTAAAPREVLLTDTVGFIRELPKPLLGAFRATLEETRDANLLLLVVDLADPAWQSQLEAVHQLLDGLNCDQLRKVVANQIDRCSASAFDAIGAIEPDVMYLSATEGTGLKGLRDWIEKQFWDPTSSPATLSNQEFTPDYG